MCLLCFMPAKQSKNAVTITGFRDKSAVILEKDFKSIGEHILMTDNGSAGRQGFVTEALKDVIGNADMVCACGPMVMLRGVAEIALSGWCALSDFFRGKNGLWRWRLLGLCCTC